MHSARSGRPERTCPGSSGRDSGRRRSNAPTLEKEPANRGPGSATSPRRHGEQPPDPAPAAAGVGRWSGRSARRNSDGATAAVDPRPTCVRREVAQPHGTGEHLRLETRWGGPAVATPAAGTLLRTRSLGGRRRHSVGRCRRRGGPARAGYRCRRGVGDRREEPGVRGAMTAGVRCGGAVPAERSRRSNDRGGRLGCGGGLRSPTPATGARDRRSLGGATTTAGRRGDLLGSPTPATGTRGRRVVEHHGEVADHGKARRRRGVVDGCGASPSGMPGDRHGLGRGGVRRPGWSARCHGEVALGEVTLGEAQGGEVGPGRLLDAAEDDAHPDLAGAVRVMPPAEQLAGPPGPCLIDLDRLGLTGEHRCSGFHSA